MCKGWQGMNWIRQDKRLAIYLRDRFTCAYCGTDLHSAEPGMVSLDHLKPRSQGGSNSERNLVTACSTCNSSRGDKPWTEFAPEGAHARIRNSVRRKLPRDLARSILAGEARLDLETR